MFRAQQEGSSTPPDPNDLVVIDWQATGGGHLSTEVFYMLIQASCRQPSIRPSLPSEIPFCPFCCPRLQLTLVSDLSMSVSGV